MARAPIIPNPALPAVMAEKSGFSREERTRNFSASVLLSLSESEVVFVLTQPVRKRVRSKVARNIICSYSNYKFDRHLDRHRINSKTRALFPGEDAAGP